jgi:hypothetical protein
MEKLKCFRMYPAMFVAFMLSSVAFTSCKKVIQNPTDLPEINIFGGDIQMPSMSYTDSFFEAAVKYVEMKAGKYYDYKDSVAGKIKTYYSAKSERIEYDFLSFKGYRLELNTTNPFFRWFIGSIDYHGGDSEILMVSNGNVVFELHKRQNDNKIIDGISIEGITYNGVLECASVNTVTNIKVVALWVQGIGLIKMTTISSSATNVITLVRHW